MTPKDDLQEYFGCSSQAGILHDTVEDTPASIDDIRRCSICFGVGAEDQRAFGRAEWNIDTTML